MSPRTSGPDDGPRPEDGSTDPSRGRRTGRARRAGRNRDATDFREMFGKGRESGTSTPRTESPPERRPSEPALREPRAADRFVRGRTRLTVRELMEQMNAEAEQAPAKPAAKPAPRAPRRTSPPRPPVVPGPAPDDSPTTVHRFDNDVTQKIPTIGADGPRPDLSDAATEKRVTEESRGQDSHVAPPSAPLQPMPDLTTRIREIRDRPRPTRHPEAPDRRRRATRNATTTGRVLVAIACVTALVGTGFVWGYLKSTNSNWRNVVATDPNDGNIRNKDAQYGDETYLIVGTDTRSGQNSKVGAGSTADAEGARADTVILVNIPANRSRVVAVSFPRDLQVDRPDCQSWDNANGTYTGDLPAADGTKLNGVYAEGGPQCLVKVLTKMSGLNINHFIAMDFFGFEKVVRAIGGVEVCSTVPLYDYELGQILRKPGKQKLTGKRALNYVRARKIASEGNGDYGRIKRQQLFLSSLLRSTLSGNVLGNPNKLNSIVNTFIEYSFVDRVDTRSLLALADSMQGIEAGRVSFLTIPTSGTTEDGQYNEIPRTEDIDTIFNAIIEDQPLPGEQAKKKAPTSKKSTSSSNSDAQAAPTGPATPTRARATAQNPGNVGVRVLNGSGRPGVAAEVSDQLAPYGFDVRGVADASEQRSDTVVRYGPGQEDAAATLAEVFPGANIQLDRTVKSGVEVILGTTFDGRLGTVPDVGSTLNVNQLAPAINTSNLPNDLAVTNAGDTTCS